MQANTSNKAQPRFVDTSLLRPLLVGPQAYRDYLAGRLGDAQLYVSPYVMMEFKRGFLRSLIDFYFLLSEPLVPTIGDALKLWSERFDIRSIKNVSVMCGELFDLYGIRHGKSSDKQKALDLLAKYIKRIWLLAAGKCINNGRDGTRCALARIEPRLPSHNIRGGLLQFVRDFDDARNHRRGCKLHQFLTAKKKTDVDKLACLRADKTVGQICQVLAEISERGERVCTCHRCKKIGDAIIALDADREMSIDHTDSSFNVLCPPLRQPHTLHLNPSAQFKELNTRPLGNGT